MTNPLITAAWEAIGWHSAQIAATGKQGPGDKLLSAMKDVEDHIAALTAENAAQAQQIAQDRADAVRYRWLLHAPVSKQDIWLAYLPEQANDYADRQIALAAMKGTTHA